MNMLFHQIAKSSFIDYPFTLGHLGYLRVPISLFVFWRVTFAWHLYQPSTPMSELQSWIPHSFDLSNYSSFPLKPSSHAKMQANCNHEKKRHCTSRIWRAVWTWSSKLHPPQCVLDSCSSSTWVGWALTWVCKSG